MSDQNDATSAHAAAAAVHTLQRLGYTYRGGEQWAPPIGNPPGWATATNDEWQQFQEWRAFQSTPVRNNPQSWAHNEIPAGEQGKS